MCIQIMHQPAEYLAACCRPLAAENQPELELKSPLSYAEPPGDHSPSPRADPRADGGSVCHRLGQGSSGHIRSKFPMTALGRPLPVRMGSTLPSPTSTVRRAPRQHWPRPSQLSGIRAQAPQRSLGRELWPPPSLHVCGQRASLESGGKSSTIPTSLQTLAIYSAFLSFSLSFPFLLLSFFLFASNT